MRLSRLSRSVTSWIASLAILMAALAPAISQAAYRVSGDAKWLEICTAYGLERIRVDSDPDPDDDAAKGLGKPCVYCTFFVGALPAQPCPACVPAAQAGAALPGISSLDLPRPGIAWAASRVRAPPVPA